MTTSVRSSGTNDNLAAALAYAARGWHVFPLRPGSKKPATPTHPADRCDGTDPRCAAGHTGWEQRATTCPDRITRAWTRTPTLGVGIACGPSGLVVVDLDTPKPGGSPETNLPAAWADVPGVVDGSDVLAVLAERAARPWPLTRTATTPSGGLHLYFVAPDGAELHNTTARLGPMVDTRGRGGYIAAPPTTTPAGSYRVHADDDPAPLPTWLATALSAPVRTAPAGAAAATRGSAHCGGHDPDLSRYFAAALAHELGRVTHAAPGTRNQALFTSALALGQLVGAGALQAERVATALHDAATIHVGVGAFTTAEAAATIASGLRRGVADPRNLPTTGSVRAPVQGRRECA